MSALTVTLSEELPARLLREIGGLRERFAGGDQLVLLIGDRRLVIPEIENCPGLRREVGELVERAAA